MERIYVRRRLKRVTNAQGWPTSRNIARTGPDGLPERVFLQEELFGPEEYGRWSPTTMAWRGTFCSRPRPTGSMPRRASAYSCRSSTKRTVSSGGGAVIVTQLSGRVSPRIARLGVTRVSPTPMP